MRKRGSARIGKAKQLYHGYVFGYFSAPTLLKMLNRAAKIGIRKRPAKHRAEPVSAEYLEAKPKPSTGLFGSAAAFIRVVVRVPCARLLLAGAGPM